MILALEKRIYQSSKGGSLRFKYNGLRPQLRGYVTRSEFDSPFQYIPKRKKPFISWKLASFGFGIGAFLAYNETLFNLYQSYTSVDQNDPSLPLKLIYELKHLSLYEKLAHPKNDQWELIQTWEGFEKNILNSQELPDGSSHGNKDPLTDGVLAKPGAILIKPVVFHNKKSNQNVTFVHTGYKLCGYPFLVHGGVVATLLNESFKRNASLSSETSSKYKEDYKVENLEITYKYPTFANQFLIIKTQQKPDTVSDSNNILLEAVIESQKGDILVKSEARLKNTGRYSKRSILSYFGN
ncbi:Piso0_000279 [Millerozyma farinosa CBS 7064]|uniref:Piso0_000279 protein n=1 Tax=Pichia sorbitophila (strain ATCC MYA-4447 / BCRC 22081 / CBS 7064 / NBRC 10061 / NRRL Y-12695) TaxID=559304 RepID=G8YTJ8_PICSO|nr:Piso0_000279 [Millerozyma farinosa CBS 7064]